MKIANRQTLLIAFLLLWGFQVAGLSQNSFFDVKIGSYPGTKSGTKVNPGIATGAHSGAYIRIGEDLSTLCSRFAVSKAQPRFRLNVFATEGGFDSLKRLLYESEVQLAVVQSDFYHFANFASDSTHPFSREFSAAKRKSWSNLADSIRIVVPLYTEKIHVVVRNDPSGNPEYSTLMDLFKAEARVNIGTRGSGAMVTCTLLDQAIMESMPSLPKWKPSFLPADAALERLLGDHIYEGREALDAVILVGAVPFPALERFSVKQAMEIQKMGLFRKKVEIKAQAKMALIPFGNEIDQILDRGSHSYFRRTAFLEGDYDFLTGKSVKVNTRGVTACLVTHKAYSAGQTEAHKIEWVRHILFRLLSNLNQRDGLVREFGSPRAGRSWAELSNILQDIEGGREQWSSFGWKRHDDPVLQQMVDRWASGVPSTPNLIDPDDPYDPY